MSRLLHYIMGGVRGGSVAQLNMAGDTLNVATDSIAIDAALKVTENVTVLNCLLTTPVPAPKARTPHF